MRCGCVRPDVMDMAHHTHTHVHTSKCIPNVILLLFFAYMKVHIFLYHMLQMHMSE